METIPSKMGHPNTNSQPVKDFRITQICFALSRLSRIGGEKGARITNISEELHMPALDLPSASTASLPGPDPAFVVENSAGCVGVEGRSTGVSLVPSLPSVGVRGASSGVSPFPASVSGLPGPFFASIGVEGISTVSKVGNINAVGVFGHCDNGTGVQGNSTTGNGVQGISDGGNAVEGNSEHGGGVVGFSGNGVGVQGKSTASNATGFLGGTDPVFHQHAGVYGQSDQQGVMGLSMSPTGTGVYGGNTAAGGGAGIGVRGETFDGVGVQGRSFGKGLAGRFVGDLEVTGDIRLVNADCAEDFDVTGPDEVEPGTVMVIDGAGGLQPSRRAYDRRVAGVISGAGDLRPGIVLDKHESGARRMPVALQ
jgi:hypothetical protein